MTNVSAIRDPFLSVSKVAQIFDVSPYTVREWLKSTEEGSLQGIKIQGHWKVRESEVNRLAKEKYE